MTLRNEDELWILNTSCSLWEGTWQ